MTETPEPDSSALPEQDIGDDTESIPGAGPVSAGDAPPEPDAQTDTGGPDSQLAPNKD